MDRVRFDSLVREYTELSEASPVTFRRRLWTLVGLAIVYFASVLLALVAVIGWGLLAFRADEGNRGIAVLMAFASFGLFGAVRGLVARVTAPEGRRLAREEAPELFDLVESLRSEMGVGKLAGVWVDGSYNAGAFQRPIFGLFGFARYHLCLGLPLVGSMPANQFRAILAHELAHFAHQHGRWGLWLYRFQHSWEQVGQSGLAGLLLVCFDRLVGARFAAATSVHARGQEFEADLRAAEVVGKEVVGGALVRLQVGFAEFESVFLCDFGRATSPDPEPPSNAITQAVGFLRGLDLAGARARRHLLTAFGEPLDWDDTHPALFQRLRNLGLVGADDSPEAAIDRALALDRENQASDALREWVASPAALLEVGDVEWRKEAAKTWPATREAALAAKARREELALRAEGRGPSLVVEEQWEQVRLVAELEGDAAARPALEAFLQRHPEHPEACLYQAGLLYEVGDASCLEWVERAAHCDPVHVPTRTSLQQQWLRESGAASKADAIQTDLLQQQEVLEDAAAERAIVSIRSRFAPHRLAGTIVERVAEHLANSGDTKRGYLVRRELTHLPERPQFIIAVEIKRRAWWKFQRSSHVGEALERLSEQLDFPHDWLTLSFDELSILTRRRIRRVPESLFYRDPGIAS